MHNDKIIISVVVALLLGFILGKFFDRKGDVFKTSVISTTITEKNNSQDNDWLNEYEINPLKVASYKK
ncbi:MAG: hypothetical protein AAB893_03260 [Patescibacteria group bacterium]